MYLIRDDANSNGNIMAANSTARGDEFLSPDALIAVGVGVATLACDESVVHERVGGAMDEPMAVAEAERLARTSPGRDWCIHLIDLLDDRHYRRVGEGLWKLYQRGYGLS